MTGSQLMPDAQHAKPTSIDPADWQVTLTPLQDRRELEHQWRVLEQSSKASFFISWDWMGALLDSAQGIETPQVLRVNASGELKGIALLWSGHQRRLGLIRTRSLHLNETGRPEFDRITMEHNGILSAAGDEVNVLNSAIKYLAEHPDWDECFLSGLDDGLTKQLDEVAPLERLWHQRRWTKAFHFVDLEAVRNVGGDYLDSLSSNSRYQAKRAIKGYAAFGPLTCERAASTSEALTWFEDLVRLHQAHWTAKGEPGAFSSSFTRSFHTTLITRGWERGNVSILRVMAGPELLGYLYNFERNGIASNYQSGHAISESNKLKPGLVIHCLAVQEALKRGLATYDLLMGGDHFKPSLCNASGEMSWSKLQQRRLPLGIEMYLRKARDRWHLRSSLRATAQSSNNENKS
ncbi:GNAT family N-acetyltransferase [Roseateles sp.]|uniref:GNAT family N-acetyltransferase n=1 Tax=Roseateles sp. TaxID=1971397 RepID=UPI003BA48C40